MKPDLTTYFFLYSGIKCNCKEEMNFTTHSLDGASAGIPSSFALVKIRNCIFHMMRKSIPSILTLESRSSSIALRRFESVAWMVGCWTGTWSQLKRHD